MTLLRAVCGLFALTLALTGCGPAMARSGHGAAPVEEQAGAQAEAQYGPLEVPAEPGSLAPSLTRLEDGTVILAWLQEVGSGHELRYGEVGPRGVAISRLAGQAEDLFANWADRPGLHVLPEGQLAAHWLRRLGEETYAYGVEMRVQTEATEGASPRSFWLHDDTSPTEHGFVASLPEKEVTRFFWLDGRAMAHEGPMALRSTSVDARGAAPSEILDSRVCECCPTDAAATSRGPVVVYRDRSEDEIRDISIVRRTEAGWSEPRPVAVDGWKIEGCPVNGPAVAADGERVAVAWFTGADRSPRVQLAWSRDAGASFERPLVLDRERPVGRVDLQIAQGVAYVSWLARREGKGVLMLATVPVGVTEQTEALEPSELEPAELKPAELKTRVLVPSGLGRSAGYPRIEIAGSDLLVAWVAQTPSDEGSPHAGKSQVRLLRLALAEEP